MGLKHKQKNPSRSSGGGIRQLGYRIIGYISDYTSHCISKPHGRSYHGAYTGSTTRLL
ncbi:hypothetical protein BDV35DRAFT_375178 [Aspergillus flavus]|uniref:Uncharacterized protein n=1 Tax=Aspergillus flavus TaxID=5059 RepID=A0A5N6GBQ7_ASPFL|nr:hypothetical protein BDV35DRAFT_375178 [Aspergillus flavus]